MKSLERSGCECWFTQTLADCCGFLLSLSSFGSHSLQPLFLAEAMVTMTEASLPVKRTSSDWEFTSWPVSGLVGGFRSPFQKSISMASLWDNPECNLYPPSSFMNSGQSLPSRDNGKLAPSEGFLPAQHPAKPTAPKPPLKSCSEREHYCIPFLLLR